MILLGQWYLMVNAVFVLLCAISFLLSWQFSRTDIPIANLLKLDRIFLFISIGSLIIFPGIRSTRTGNDLLVTTRTLWNQNSRGYPNEHFKILNEAPKPSVAHESSNQDQSDHEVNGVLEEIFYVLGMGCICLFFIAFVLLLIQIQKISALSKSSHIFRKIGNVQLGTHQEIQTPISYRLGLQKMILLPFHWVESKTPTELNLCIQHEFQHHRQNDTLWVYLFEFLKILLICNPFYKIWIRMHAEHQEWACDETLIHRKRVSSQTYARFLLDVAKEAVKQKPVVNGVLTKVGSVSLPVVGLWSFHCQLKRRIQTMLISKQRSAFSSVKLVVSTVVSMSSILIMSITMSLASDLVTSKGTLTLELARSYARTSSSADFEVIVNSKVLDRLNQVVSSPRLRRKLRDSLSRMQEYQDLISDDFSAYHVPLEFLAIPIVESAYRNLPSESNPATHAAGIWQFIKSTARRYGLTVTKNVDDRLDPKKETIAARKLLKDGKETFNDWKLSLLAYNIGAQNVRDGMNELKSDDCWKIEENAVGNDKDYLAKVMAAIIIMKNPDLVK